MIKVEKMALEVVSENANEINIMYGGLPFTISKKPMDFDGGDRCFSFVGNVKFPPFLIDKYHDNVFYGLTIKLSDGIAEFVSAEYWEDGKYHDGKCERHSEKVEFDFIVKFPTLREIFTNKELFDVAFSHEYEFEDSFIDMLEMGAVNLNTVFEGFFFETWKYFTYEEKKPTTKPITAKEKMIADMAKDGLDFNNPSVWECYGDENNRNTTFVIKDVNSPIYAYFVEERSGDELTHYCKRIYPSVRELYHDDDFILDLLQCDNFQGCESIVFEWLRHEPSNDNIVFEFSTYEVGCGGYDGTNEDYEDDVIELSEHQQLCKQVYEMFTNGYDVDKDFFIEEIKDNIVSKDEKGVFRVGEVGLGGHEEDGEIYIDICVYFPTKKEPTYSLDKPFGYLSEDTIKHILANMHQK